MTWQPIETAPKDGTDVLIYRHGWVMAQVVAYFDPAAEVWRGGGAEVLPGDVSHWMPLPEPPS